MNYEQEYNRVMGLLRNTKMPHGLCEPRERKACTHCNAVEELDKIIAEYKGARIVLANGGREGQGGAGMETQYYLRCTVCHARNGARYENCQTCDGEGFVPVPLDDVRLAPASRVPEADVRRLREAGWMVAVHNDYRQDGKLKTFWLFVKDGRAIKGEGDTDSEAVAQCYALAANPSVPPSEDK